MLFLERYYEAGIPHKMIRDIMKVVLRMMKKKSEQLGALLVMNMGYKVWKPEGMCVFGFFHVHIQIENR